MDAAFHIAAVLVTAALFGGMAFFSAVVAPYTFIRFEPDLAARYIRGIFPWYYLAIGALAFLAAVLLALPDPVAAAAMAAIAATTVYARQVLMPAINGHRDRAMAGSAADDAAFERLHAVSVWINAGQLLAGLCVLVRLAL
ncbi:MAG: DUF4149 domain-containing protein [Gammaproteobacteria bacterium]